MEHLRRLVLRSQTESTDDEHTDADADVLIGASVAVSLERAVEAWS